MKTLAKFLILLVPVGLIGWGTYMVYAPATPLVMGFIAYMEIRRLWA